MLTRMRESIKNSKFFKYLLIIFICAPFAFFGINSYFGNGGSSFAVKIDGEEVPVQVFDRELNMQRNRLRQAFGGKIPEGFANDDLMRKQALDSVITSQVVAQLLRDHEVVVSDISLAKAITQTEAFQVDGRFDSERYEMQLRSAGYTVDSFENQFRQDLAQISLRDGIVQSNFVLPNETGSVLKLINQTRNADYITFELAPILEKTEISNEEIAQYFEDNKDIFTHPERVKLEYIELSSETLQADIDISEEDAKIYFDDNNDNYRVPEERSASHILLTLPEDADEKEVADKLKRIQEIKKKLDAGDKFEDLAKEYSEDPGSKENGGSLGFFGRGAMVPAFEETAYNMEKGVVSDPVRSSFGYHIIRLDDIKAAHGKDFPVVKGEIITLLKQQKSDEIFFDKNEILSNQTYENPDSLIPAAESGNFEVLESDWIDRLTKTGVAANPKIINAALAAEVLTQGNNSPVIELGENHAVVLRVKDHEDPRPKTLDEVQLEISELLKSKTAKDVLVSIAGKAKEKIESGERGSNVAEELGGVFALAKEVKRASVEDDKVLVDALFKMPKPNDSKNQYGVVELTNGDQVVFSLRSVTDGKIVEDEKLVSTQGITPDQIGNAEYQALVRHLSSKAVVEINEQILQPIAQ